VWNCRQICIIYCTSFWAVDRDFDKLSLGTENGFIWDIVSPGSNEFLKEDGVAKESTSEVGISNDAFIFDLISLFKNIGDAWIKGMWARNFQMRGSGYLEKNHSFFGFCIAPRCES
jgi:hypothetical protein